jgi:hypothetical protein
MIWAHSMENSRGVQPYPERWKYLDQMLADPAFRHVDIDPSWGPVIAPYIVDTLEHLKMTANLIRKYLARFLCGSDQGATTDWKLGKEKL